jgi:hypothetical protein
MLVSRLPNTVNEFHKAAENFNLPSLADKKPYSLLSRVTSVAPALTQTAATVPPARWHSENAVQSVGHYPASRLPSSASRTICWSSL